MGGGILVAFLVAFLRHFFAGWHSSGVPSGVLEACFLGEASPLVFLVAFLRRF